MPQEFDAALKSLFVEAAGALLRSLAGAPVEEHLPTEVPRVNAPRVDVLARLVDGTLFHLELQTTNDADLAWRPLAYRAALHLRRREHPRQVVLYVGKPALSMSGEISLPELWFRVPVVDVRDLDGDQLAETGDYGDAIVAVLAKVRDERTALRRALSRIATLEGEARRTAYAQLWILVGLRGLEDALAEEARNMAFEIDIMENKFLRGLYEQGQAEGKTEGKAETLRALLTRRFGTLPSWAEERLTHADVRQLDAWSLAIFDAESLGELLDRA